MPHGLLNSADTSVNKVQRTVHGGENCARWVKVCNVVGRIVSIVSSAGLGNGIDTITILSSDCFPSLPINRQVIIFNRTLIIGICNDD